VLGRLERTERPKNLKIRSVGCTGCIELHEEHLVERRAQYKERRMIEEHGAPVLAERRRQERGGSVVEPRGRQTVTCADCDDCDFELLVETTNAVDVARCVAQAVPCEQRATNNDQNPALAIRLKVLRYLGDVLLDDNRVERDVRRRTS
jgi:hypothetical protein